MMEKSDNENAMSCDPADPRRSPVPGLESVKSATEDSAGVSDQAPVTVNITGKKTYVQQAFHPSFFNTRPRSSSLGSKSPNIIEDMSLIIGKGPKGQSPKNSNETRKAPPDWQRIPTARGAKRKKLTLSPSPDRLLTTNRYSHLPVDENEEQTQNQPPRPVKPPPIILYGIEDINKLTELLGTTVDKSQFFLKIVNKNQLRVNSLDVDVYKKLITIIREQGLIGHTFNRKDNRCCRLVIKNLHHTTPIDAIKQEIEKTGNTVSGEIVNARYGPQKKPTSTFFVNLLPHANNKFAKKIKYIYHQSVTIEDPKKKKTVVQCQRCQQYGHSKNYCMRPYRCVKCAQSHKTSECTKKDRNTPAKCALCLGPHPANYKGCEVYREILVRKIPKQPPRKPPQVTEKEPEQVFEHKQAAKQRMQYAIALKSQKPSPHEPPTKTNEFSNLETLLTRQSEKFDLILQQMSTLMSLITTLVDKLAKK